MYLSLLSFTIKEKSPAPITSQGPPTSMMPSVLGPTTPPPAQSVLSLNHEPLPVTPPCSLTWSTPNLTASPSLNFPTSQTPNSTGLTEPELILTAAETIVVAPSEPGELLEPDAVINKYPKLMSLTNIGRLDVRLVCESYFGEHLLKKCTVVGCNNKPAFQNTLF